MKVLLPNHPIMQGIPLDAQNRVKIWRDPYPDENAHVLASAQISSGIHPNTGIPTNPCAMAAVP